MKIAILSRKPSLYSTRRLKEAAEARKHKVSIIDPLRCYLNITTQNSTVHYKGKPLPRFDAVIPRVGASVTAYGAAIVRHFETMGTFCLNSSMSITRSRDKFRSLQLLARKGIGLPITGLAHAPGDIDDLIAMVGGPPLIIKLIEGTQGIGVVLAETKKAAHSVIQAFLGLKENILVQEFIAESQGCDIRCIVLGDKVIATMARQAAPGEFRANLHRGGTTECIKITPDERKLAIKAAKIMGLHLSGVDIVRAKRGPLILEVNSSPGLRGIETVNQKKIAEAIIEYIEKNAKPITSRSHYHG